MNTCLWCDDPCGSEKLCPTCKACNDHPPFFCDKPNHGSTLGPYCSQCYYEDARNQRARLDNQPLLNSLLAIREQTIKAVKSAAKTPSHFAVGFVGKMVDGAIDSLAPIYGQPYLDQLKKEAYDKAGS